MSEPHPTIPTRRENRLAAVQFLYMWDLNPSGQLEDALKAFFALKTPFARSQYAFAESLISGALENIDTIDALIKEHSKNWRFSRIQRVDLAVLRNAIYELLFCKDIPPIVTINEAIDIAKTLSNADSKRFVNGILDRLKATLNRPLRSI